MNNNFLPYQLKKNAEQNSALAASLAQITSQNNNTITYAYNPDGSIQSETEKDTNNNVIRTVTYTYTAAGDLVTSVTVANGKTVTITYNYDASGNVTTITNALA